MYKLPELNYKYNELEPYISEEQLKIHHLKHHMAYVNGANALLGKEWNEENVKNFSKELSFNVAGHLLHSLFWGNLKPRGELLKGKIKAKIEKDFNGFENFKKLFSKLALSVEGSGWATLVYCKQLDRLMLMQIEKHNVNVIPMFKVILVLDVFEHAYYIDHKNDRAKFVENFWNIIDWDEVGRRYEKD